MSNLANDKFIEQAWEKYRHQYIRFCIENNIQADLSDFWIWLDDNDLIPEAEYER